MHNFFNWTTYSLSVLVANEPFIELRAGDLELAVQVVSRLAIGVGDLAQEPLIIVNHLRPVYLSSIGRHLAIEAQRLEQLQRYLHSLMLSVECRGHQHSAMVKLILKPTDRFTCKDVPINEVCLEIGVDLRNAMSE